MFSFIAKRCITVLPRRGDLSIVRFITTSDSTANNSFAVSYLINTCGVPKDKAISALKTIHFESSKNPDLVLAFLRDSGFSNTHISKIIGSFPELLMSKVDKTLKPKFDFLKSQGITGSDLAQVVCTDVVVLRASLEKRIIPYFELIRSIVHSDAQLITMLKRSARVLREGPHKNIIPNITLLRAEGVPDYNISKSLVAQPRSILKPTSRFRDIVEEVKKMKFDPKQYLFILAIHGLTQMSRSSLKAKFDVYRRWGLSEEELQCVFRKNPNCLMISEKKIMSTMNYFVNEMGYSSSSIAQQPHLLLLSLTRRIIPRCSVIRILKGKGMVGKGHSLSTFLQLPEEVFLKKYVIQFEKEVPELLTTYQGKGR